jgi:hypothetical protein
MSRGRTRILLCFSHLNCLKTLATTVLGLGGVRQPSVNFPGHLSVYGFDPFSFAGCGRRHLVTKVTRTESAGAGEATRDAVVIAFRRIVSTNQAENRLFQTVSQTNQSTSVSNCRINQKIYETYDTQAVYLDRGR